MDQEAIPGQRHVARRGEAVIAQIVHHARAVVRAATGAGPPFPPERYAARCGVIEIRREVSPKQDAHLGPAGTSGREFIVTLDRRLAPHTPQWNGALARALAQTFLPAGVTGAAAETLSEIGAAELLLPMRAFRPVAARTDLTLDGLRQLAMRFAAPLRLTARQWLRAGTWRGFALLWRVEAGTLRLRWRAGSSDVRFPRTVVIGAPAEFVWSASSRLYATLRTGRPHHGIEEVRTGAGPAWWFTRFGIVREPLAGFAGAGGRGILALVTLARGC